MNADLIGLRAEEAHLRRVAEGRAEAHRLFVQIVGAYSSPDARASKAMQEERHDALVLSYQAYDLVVRAALKHDLVAAQLAVAELEALPLLTAEQDGELARRRAELADIEARTATSRAA